MSTWIKGLLLHCCLRLLPERDSSSLTLLNLDQTSRRPWTRNEEVPGEGDVFPPPAQDYLAKLLSVNPVGIPEAGEIEVPALGGATNS